MALAIDPTNSKTVYAGANDGSLFKTTNGGASWSSVNSGLTSNNAFQQQLRMLYRTT